MHQHIVANRYVLVAELGRGAMGVVWRAQDQLLGRAVAIKELHPPQGIPAEEREVLEERMLREARTAGRLNHPAVVTVHDVISENGRTYLAMELVEAANLAAIVAQHGPRDSVWVAGIALQALGALECAHAAGIVHRDVKPSNIMVRLDGAAKLTDFGIAQAMDDPRLTTNGGLIGSPAYMSPERLSGWEASPASDLWALGVTMAHAVEGVSPFERTSTASTLHAVMNEPPALRLASPALAEVIRGLLTPDPGKRLTAGQARAMLTAIVQGTGHVPAPRKSSGKGLRIAAAVLAVVVLGAGGVFGYQKLTSSKSGSAQAGPAPASGTTSAQPAATGLPAGQSATFGRGGDVPGWNLTESQCGKDFLQRGKAVDEDVPCDAAHSIQLFGAATPFWDKPKTVDYPGVPWLADFAKKYCTDQFKAVTGSNTLEFSSLVPTEQEWKAWNDAATPGRQEILCVLWKQDRSPLTRSVVTK